MTDQQFDQLITLLNSINENVKKITAKDTDKYVYGLSDIHAKMDSVLSAVNDVGSAIKEVSIRK